MCVTDGYLSMPIRSGKTHVLLSARRLYESVIIAPYRYMRLLHEIPHACKGRVAQCIDILVLGSYQKGRVPPFSIADYNSISNYKVKYEVLQ